MIGVEKLSILYAVSTSYAIRKADREEEAGMETVEGKEA